MENGVLQIPGGRFVFVGSVAVADGDAVSGKGKTGAAAVPIRSY